MVRLLIVTAPKDVLDRCRLLIYCSEVILAGFRASLIKIQGCTLEAENEIDRSTDKNVSKHP